MNDSFTNRISKAAHTIQIPLCWFRIQIASVENITITTGFASTHTNEIQFCMQIIDMATYSTKRSVGLNLQ